MKRLWAVTAALLLTLELCLGAMASPAQAASIVDSGRDNDHITWTLTSDGTLTISGTGKVDAYIDLTDSSYKSWKRLHKDDIKRIAVENGITEISDYAFYQLSNLVSVTIPASVTKIEDSAFSLDKRLSSFIVDADNPVYRSIDGVLFNRSQTKLCAYPNGKKETSYLVPSGVTSIGSSAFYGNTTLKSIDLPAGVVNIGEGAFSNCTGLTAINLPSGVTHMGNRAFSRCSALSSVNIPASVKSIGAGAFEETALKSVSLPSGMTKIEDSVFVECTSLRDVNIPDSITSIGVGAFSECTSLTSITIPANVKDIGTAAFAGAGLTDISVDPKNKTYRSVNGVLFSYDRKELHSYPAGREASEYSVPSGTTSIREGAFGLCENLTKVNIPIGVTHIGRAAFSGCTKLTAINLPDGLSSISEYLLSDCTALKNVKIPLSVDCIESQAFARTGLKDIRIPSSVREIGEGAFAGCASLGSVVLPSGLTRIESWALGGCPNLRSVYIPASMKEIEKEAFTGCTNLKDVYYAGTMQQWDQIILRPDNSPLYRAALHCDHAAPQTGAAK